MTAYHNNDTVCIKLYKRLKPVEHALTCLRKHRASRDGASEQWSSSSCNSLQYNVLPSLYVRDVTRDS